ncbi:MAG: hypothetical protein U9R60_01935 [Bacteroidota bacterium]|nr:hypothetical protein [Bacteroidota bacterium]
MEKEIYLIRGIRSETREAFSNRIFSAINTLIASSNPKAIKVTITDKAPPKISIIPFGKSNIAAISIIDAEVSPEPTLLALDGFAGAYKVWEDLPVCYKKTWKDQAPSPGVCLLTLFRQKKNIDYETFIKRWHNGHTPLSLKLHPLWHYSRNVVKEKLADSQEWYDGIVEEHTRTRSEMLNPMKFFGNPLAMPYNMFRVYKDVRSFLDYSSVEPYLVTEYRIKG